MARPVSGMDALPLLEEAVHLLRRTPLSTLVCHVLGTAPFALALLLFWNDVNNLHTPDSTLMRESMVLALLLVWMNCWRAVFAGRMRRQLSATSDKPWTWRRTWNLFACQAFLGATKLVALPAAIISIVGFAWTVAFYRSAATLADRADLDPIEVMRKAAHLANLDRRQGWLILPIIGGLQLLVTINLAIALGMVPQLIRMLTGYESQFSRGGPFFVFTPIFLWSTLAISWMLFDPFTQAVFCLRSFHGESITTGEDIRANLRVLAAPLLIVIGLLLIVPGRSMAAVPKQDLEQGVKQAMQAPEYDWRLPAPPQPPRHEPWIVRATNYVIDQLKSIGRWINRQFDKFWQWLRKLFRMSPGVPGSGALPTQGLPGVLYAVIAALVGFLAWLAWKRNWFARRPSAEPPAPLEAIRLDAEDLTADRLPEEKWLELAAQSLREGNYRFALRAYYLANLAWLGHSEYLSISAGKTNREYELELKRRARGFGDARAVFAENIAAFERCWYGLHSVNAEDAAAFHQRINRMKSMLRPPQGAVA